MADIEDYMFEELPHMVFDRSHPDHYKLPTINHVSIYPAGFNRSWDDELKKIERDNKSSIMYKETIAQTKAPF